VCRCEVLEGRAIHKALIGQVGGADGVVGELCGGITNGLCMGYEHLWIHMVNVNTHSCTWCFIFCIRG
jgi:hypothetical protein